MSNSYKRKCKFCPEIIQMRQMPGGQWVAFEGYDTVHDCRNQATKKPAPVRSEAKPPPTYTRAPNIAVSKPSEESSYLDLPVPQLSVSSTPKVKPKNIAAIPAKEKSKVTARPVSSQNATFSIPNISKIVATLFGSASVGFFWIFLCGGFFVLMLINSSSNSVSPPRQAASTQAPTQTRAISTRTRTPTPRPQSVIIGACVTTNSLRVRTGPGIEYSLAGGLARGDCVKLDGRNSDSSWGKIRGKNEWVALEFVDLDGSVTRLPVTQPPVVRPTLLPTQIVQPTVAQILQPTQAPPTNPPAAQLDNSGESPGVAGNNCHPSYPTVCIPFPPPDLDCGDISFRRFQVVGSDPHRFDGDNDGIGCES